jgi:hypothetical protein
MGGILLSLGGKMMANRHKGVERWLIAEEASSVTEILFVSPHIFLLLYILCFVSHQGAALSTFFYPWSLFSFVSWTRE